MELATIIAVIVIALVFDYTNGFHDAANAIATSISTRALTPAGGPAAGRGDELRRRLPRHQGRQDRRSRSWSRRPVSTPWSWCFAALVGAITWNLITWYFGLPSSSSHALIGGLVGRRRWPASMHRAVATGGREGRHPDAALADRRRAARLPADARDPVDRSGTSGPARPTAASASPRRSRPRRWRSATACRTRRRRWASSCSPWWPAATRTALRHPVVGRRARRPARSRWAPTPVAGGSCAPSAAGSSRSTRRAASRPRRPRPSVLYTTAYVFEAPISTTQTITGVDHGRRRHPRPPRRALGRGRQHRHRLGAHHPDGRPGRRPRLRRRSTSSSPDPEPSSPDPAAATTPPPR